jgi:hypothetical protein
MGCLAWAHFVLALRILLQFIAQYERTDNYIPYVCVSKSFRTCRLERELQIVQLCATACSCMATLWASLVSFCCRNPSCCFSTSVYCCKRIFRYRLSPETFGYTLVFWIFTVGLGGVGIGLVSFKLFPSIRHNIWFRIATSATQIRYAGLYRLDTSHVIYCQHFLLSDHSE